MRKAMVMLVAAFVFAAFALAPIGAMACGEGKTSADNSGAASKMVSDKSGCSTTATKASAINCPAGSKEACAAKLGMTMEDCQKVCGQGQYTMVSMNVKGMTCGSCEETISASLSKIPGVVKVGKVDYKAGTAFAIIDPMKVKDEQLIKAVADKGYEAQVIPAVAIEQVPGAATNTEKMDASGCSAAQKAACAAVGKTCGGAKSAEKKDDKKTDGSM